MRNLKGFGIIELMISILVASIIVVGLYSLLTSSILSYGFSKATNQAVSSSHRVNMSFNTLLYQAGFMNYTRAIQNYAFPATTTNFSDNVNWPENVVLIGGRENNQDFIKIRFAGASLQDDKRSQNVTLPNDKNTPNGFVFDCNGIPVPNTAILEIKITVTNNGLECQENALENTNTATFDIDNNSIILDPFVKNLRLQYSMVNDGGVSGFIDSNNIATAQWNLVSLVRYSFVTSQPSSQKMVRSATGLTLNMFADAGVTNNNYVIPDNDRSNVHRVQNGNIAIVNQL
jgi:hypothetical protein